MATNQDGNTTLAADAKLIALCAEFEKLERENNALYEGDLSPAEEREADKLHEPRRERQAALLSEIIELQASTSEGIKARLKMILTYEPAALANPEDFEGCMIGALLRDMKEMFL